MLEELLERLDSFDVQYYVTEQVNGDVYVSFSNNGIDFDVEVLMCDFIVTWFPYNREYCMSVDAVIEVTELIEEYFNPFPEW